MQIIVTNLLLKAKCKQSLFTLIYSDYNPLKPSGYFTCHQVFTICLHSVFLCSVLISVRPALNIIDFNLSLQSRFHLSTILHTNVRIHITLTRRTNWHSLKTFKSNVLSKIELQRIGKYFYLMAKGLLDVLSQLTAQPQNNSTPW